MSIRFILYRCALIGAFSCASYFLGFRVGSSGSGISESVSESIAYFRFYRALSLNGIEYDFESVRCKNYTPELNTFGYGSYRSVGCFFYDGERKYYYEVHMGRYGVISGSNKYTDIGDGF